MSRKPFSSPSDIRVAVVGYGGAFNMGKAHLSQCQEAGMTPAAVCEIDPSRLEVAEVDFPGIGKYSRVEEMLKEDSADLVILITPHNTHAPLALECLEAGRHVVTEKPFAITTDECDAMIAAADRKGLMVSTFHNRHWDGSVLRAMEQVVEKKVIGDVHRIDLRSGGYGMPRDWWRSIKTASGGILYDWGVHLLEYALQVMGPDAKIEEVSGFARSGHWASRADASSSWKSDPNEDEGFAVIRLSGNRWITLTVTSLEQNTRPHMFEATGDSGTYWWSYHEWTSVTREDNYTVSRTGKNPPDQHARYYQNVADHLARNEPLVITPQWARRPIHILDLAVRSAVEGKALPARYE